MPRDSETSSRRRLTTPPRGDTQSRIQPGSSRSQSRRHRSRSLIRNRGPGSNRSGRLQSRSRSKLSRDRDLREREQELEKQRERLRALEERVIRERSRLRCRDDRDPESRVTARNTRSRSPTFNCKDVIKLINSLKPQPVTAGSSLPSTNNSINSKNILPDFDPSVKTQRTDIWIRKVNECATVYGWDERTTVHFAMQKLQGLAKVWYESQNSILFNWLEWQEKLLSAFPCEQNYGQSLEDMLRRKTRYNEPLEVYYYEKLALLNQCDIAGKHAVDCLIHGLSDRNLRSSANALRCTQPDQLLQFLMSNQDTSQTVGQSDRNRVKSEQHGNNSTDNSSRKLLNQTNTGTIFCFNCKEKGHPYLKCPKPLIQCTKCNRYGHRSDSCKFRNDVQTDQTHKADPI